MHAPSAAEVQSIWRVEKMKFGGVTCHGLFRTNERQTKALNGTLVDRAGDRSCSAKIQHFRTMSIVAAGRRQGAGYQASFQK
jgi:hypothetical protein